MRMKPAELISKILFLEFSNHKYSQAEWQILSKSPTLLMMIKYKHIVYSYYSYSF